LRGRGMAAKHGARQRLCRTARTLGPIDAQARDERHRRHRRGEQQPQAQ
jgi:hypothetical protein